LVLPGFQKKKEKGKMKKILPFMMILLIVLPMFVVFTSKVRAGENVIFQDDFESYAVGTFPSSGGWQLVYNGAGDQYQVITSDYSASGSQSLQMEGQYGWSAVVAKDFASGSNLIGFEAYLMGTSGSWPSVGFGNEAIQPWGRLYGAVGVDTIDGYIVAGSQNLQPCTANTWYKIREVMDRNAGTFDVWIDDQLKRTNIQEANNPWEIQSLRFDVGWHNVPNYYDDVKVFEVSGTPPPQGDLWIENIEPVQTIINPSVMIPGKPTVFKVTIVSTFPDGKSGVYLLMTCGSQSWYEGPYTIGANQKTIIYTGGKEVWGQCYRPSGEFDVSIKIAAFSPNAQTFTKHIGLQTGYQFKNLGPLKVLYVPVGFWSGPTAWLLGDPHIPPDNMTREVTFSDSFIKAVFPVDPALYKSEIASEYPLPAPPLGDPVTRRAWAALEVAELDSVMNLYHMPSMGGYDRIILVVPSRSDDLWFKYWLNKDALGMNLVLPDSVIWCQEGYYTTPAHELWHSYTGISDAVWHCPNTATGYWDLAHSRGSSGLIDGGLPVPCMMSGGDQHYAETDWAYRWICPHCYANLTNLSRLKYCPDPEVLFVSGVVFSNDTVNLQPFYHFSEGYADLNPGTVGNYTVRFRDANQQVLSNIGFNMTFDTSLNVTGFGFAVPYPSGAAQIQLLHGDAVIASRNISANVPTVNITYPNDGAILTSGGNVTIQWEAYDADNDALSYSVLYTPDNGSSWIPIGTGIPQTSLNCTVPNDHPTNECRIKVVATDGVNSGEDLSNGTFTIFRHDVATTSIQASKTVVGEGYTLPIHITVQNNGNFIETLHLKVYANTTLIHAQNLTLTSGTSSTVTFAWNTTDWDIGNYTLRAYIEPVAGEINTVDNQLSYTMIQILSPNDIHDIAITELTLGKTIVGQDYNLNISTQILNYGGNAEDFNLTICVNGTIIQCVETTLAGKNSTTIIFTLNTTGFAKGNYAIWAYAWPVPDETDTADNSLTDGWAVITIIGDINGDFKVDIKDLVLVIKYFGSYPSHPTKPWNPNADLNSDGKVDIKDLVLVIKHYGEHYP
jgi:hypothetical protein